VFLAAASGPRPSSGAGNIFELYIEEVVEGVAPG
jgi:hypothetical protein